MRSVYIEAFLPTGNFSRVYDIRSIALTELMIEILSDFTFSDRELRFSFIVSIPTESSSAREAVVSIETTCKAQIGLWNVEVEKQLE